MQQGHDEDRNLAGDRVVGPWVGGGAYDSAYPEHVVGFVKGSCPDEDRHPNRDPQEQRRQQQRRQQCLGAQTHGHTGGRQSHGTRVSDPRQCHRVESGEWRVGSGEWRVGSGEMCVRVCLFLGVTRARVYVYVCVHACVRGACVCVGVCAWAWACWCVRVLAHIVIDSIVVVRVDV